ncbi:chemotaxis protein CheW [Clostridium sp. A1-XYC3]|uniref:Chemotaxis protein CheW n=1 Tax=Clostridium tanneri TaxID=3037988 RepID=A0ABU4JQY1_9CLOT|nr:chemotaxis protein CheW [Clostridium sp. A1-XYC3]MDW8800535.1 chemotaxis protein CheW [Clostridium sp. A1-XYC3]
MDDLLDSQYVIFKLADDKCALKINDIFEIIKMQKITAVPNSRAFLEGIINLRGKVVPVVNIHKRFGIKNYSATKSTRIIVVESRDEIIGMIVDEVSQVLRFKEIQQAPDMLGELDSSYFLGIGIIEEGIAGILKIDKILYHE